MDYRWEWQTLLQKYEKILNAESGFQEGFVYQQACQLALGAYKLRCFAEQLRSAHIAIWELPEPLSWLDLLRHHLVNKHHWNLETVRSIVDEKDFLYLFREELGQMMLTEEEAAPVRFSTESWNCASAFALHFETSFDDLPFG